MLKGFEYKEVLMMFNLNWYDAAFKSNLKHMMKTQKVQTINNPTRLTKASQTLINVIFTNKPERIIKKT